MATYVCTNKNCSNGLPHYKNFGQATKRKCSSCGKSLRKVKMEPRS